MSTLKPHIASVAAGNVLSFDEAREAFGIIMSGEATPGQIGAFLMALRVRGESVSEISGAVATMREKMLPVEAPAAVFSALVGAFGAATSGPHMHAYEPRAVVGASGDDDGDSDGSDSD